MLKLGEKEALKGKIVFQISCICLLRNRPAEGLACPPAGLQYFDYTYGSHRLTLATPSTLLAVWRQNEWKLRSLFFQTKQTRTKISHKKGKRSCLTPSSSCWFSNDTCFFLEEDKLCLFPKTFYLITRQLQHRVHWSRQQRGKKLRRDSGTHCLRKCKDVVRRLKRKRLLWESKAIAPSRS